MAPSPRASTSCQTGIRVPLISVAPPQTLWVFLTRRRGDWGGTRTTPWTPRYNL